MGFEFASINKAFLEHSCACSPSALSMPGHANKAGLRVPQEEVQPKPRIPVNSIC